MELKYLILKINSFIKAKKRGHFLESFYLTGDKNKESLITACCRKCDNTLYIDRETGRIFGYIIFNDCRDTELLLPFSGIKRLIFMFKYCIDLFF